MGSLFKRAQQKENKMSKTTNPFTKDGIRNKATDDRYMNLAISKRNWQIAAFIFIGVIVLQDIQLGRTAVHSKVEPWLVELNNGQVVNAVRGKPLDPSEKGKLINIYLRSYIRDARTVNSDTELQKSLLDKVYARTTEKATAYLNEYYNTNNPFKLAAKFTVLPEIVYVLPMSDNTWEITWDERKRSAVDGSLIETNRFVALVSYKVAAATNMDLNPFGIYITNLTWSKSN